MSALPPPLTALNEDGSLLSHLKVPEYRGNRFIHGRGSIRWPHQREAVLDDRGPRSADSSLQGG